MFTRHVKKYLSAYAHGELTTEETERVARHLRSCANCRAEFDRIRLGHVTDFIDLNWWSFRIFNLADTFIVVGVAILLVALVAADKAPRPPRRTLDVAAR